MKLYTKAMNKDKLPKWDLESIYSSVDSKEFNSDIKKVYALSKELKEKSKDKTIPLIDLIKLRDELRAVLVNVSSYSYTSFSVDTTNPSILSAYSKCEKMESEAQDADSVFLYNIAEREDEFSSPELKDYALFLEEAKVSRKHMMSLEEESLANEMLQVSASSWDKLHMTVTAAIKDGDKTLTQLRGLAMSPDREVRKAAYEREIKILKENEIALAAALNGVKGTTLMLEKRKGWKDPIDRSLFASRITHKTLDALISALEDSREMFRDYLKTKAKLLGLEKLEWYDMFAPVGNKSMSYTWEEAKDLVTKCYTSFSPEVGAFIKNAFDHNWIDALAHEGKIGGAYDISFPLKGESRVMMNWEGTYDSVSTLAHELGHAYHDSVVKSYPMSQSDYPMTLAETASIFGETNVFQEVLKTATKDEKLPIIEAFVSSCCQVCIDILSRYYFEKSAFEKRKDGDVSPEDFCSLMLKAQEDTYGDGLGIKHPYMWAVKGHYYSYGFSFYNYPYAFGQLFALGLFASKDSVDDFPQHYKNVLSMTGRYKAEEVAKAAGCDIESKEFWMKGIKLIGTYVEALKEWL